MPAAARLELRIAPAEKRLIEEAAAARQQSVTAFVIETAVRRSRDVLGGREPATPRPIGGWSFTLLDGWDDPLADFETWR